LANPMAQRSRVVRLFLIFSAIAFFGGVFEVEERGAKDLRYARSRYDDFVVHRVTGLTTGAAQQLKPPPPPPRAASDALSGALSGLASEAAAAGVNARGAPVSSWPFAVSPNGFGHPCVLENQQIVGGDLAFTTVAGAAAAAVRPELDQVLPNAAAAECWCWCWWCWCWCWCCCWRCCC